MTDIRVGDYVKRVSGQCDCKYCVMGGKDFYLVMRVSEDSIYLYIPEVDKDIPFMKSDKFEVYIEVYPNE